MKGVDGESRRCLLKWYLGKFLMPQREEGVLEEEAGILDELMTRDKNWTPEETRKVLAATKALSEHAWLKRG